MSQLSSCVTGLIVGLAVLCATGRSASAALVTIDFDDLTPANGSFFVENLDDRPNPYQGLFWSDLNMFAHSYYSSTYADPTPFPSLTMAAFTDSAGNGAAAEVDSTLGSPLFDLVSVDISKKWPWIAGYAADEVTISGLVGGAVVDTRAVSLTGSWQNIVLGTGFKNLDEFRIKSSAGGGYFIFDNVVIRPVPEPSSLVLIATSLVAGQLRSRRRR
ncbi:MAG: PEP-CTERM sorting domain-containing protein [Pirellulaceae bacterium]|nr:PEP-CTERM sorting domain-containing protein [Pirellulaceae bacterium]